MTIFVKPQDLPKAGLCVTGAKEWFRQYNLDFKEFIFGEGCPVEVMRAAAPGDPLGERACLEAEARNAREEGVE